MPHQKRAKIRGIPPDLTVRIEVIDKRRQTKMEDRLITDRKSVRSVRTQFTEQFVLGQPSVLWQETTATIHEKTTVTDCKTRTKY